MLTRRHALKLLAGCASVLTAPATSCYAAPTASAGPAVAALKLDALAQAALIRAGDISVGEITDAAIARIEALNPSINAVVTPLYQRARARLEALPAGPFHGVPYLLKDLIDLEGAKTSYGSRAMSDSIAAKSHPFVRAAEGAGLNILGKTNTPEFGLVATTEPRALGPCKNPWHLDYSPGGSSGGSAAAVAAGMVAVAQASDGGGSIRIPASHCGVFGLKPSRDRDLSAGLGGLAVKGHISRSIRDSAALFAATERRDTAAPYPPLGYIEGAAKRRLKIALMMNDHFGAQPDPDVKAAIAKTAEICAALGHRVEEASLGIDGRKLMDAFFVLWSAWPGKAARRLQQQLGRPAGSGEFEPWTLYLADYYLREGERRLPAAVEHLAAVTRQFVKHFDRYDVILSPVTKGAPQPLGWQDTSLPGPELRSRLEQYVSYTPVHNAAGTPAMSVPLFWNQQGLPIGSQFAGAAGQERLLFELAYELEQAQPWAERWPAVAML